MNKDRFKQLYILAHGGDMVAKADLWIEFEFAFDHDPFPAFMQEPPQGRARPPGAPSAMSSVPSVVKKTQSGGAPC